MSNSINNNDNDILEKVKDDSNDIIAIYESKIEEKLFEFADSEGYESPREFSQSVWNAALIYCNKHCISKSDLKSKDLYNIKYTNAYNTSIVNDLVDYYIYLCMKYDKECSLVGFGLLSGIDPDTFDRWKRDRVTSKNYEVYKKIIRYREESLSDKLTGGKANPVGVLAILNHHYGWNLPGVSREAAHTSISVDDIRTQLGLSGSGPPVGIGEKPTE